MLKDQEIVKAVSRIRQRAERQTDEEKLVAAYVDSGILPQIENENHQILYGRRGTGKTHVLRVCGNRLSEQGNAVVYIDCRTLGSSNQFQDKELPVASRCLALFRDILQPIYNAVLEKIVDEQPRGSEGAVESLDRLLAATLSSAEELQRTEVEVRTERENSTSKSAGLNAAIDSVGVELSQQATGKNTQATTEKLIVSRNDKIIFPAIHYFLSEALNATGYRLVILLDEWSAIPQELQPLLAEFLKRGVLPVQRATLKVAALEQRSVFSVRDGSKTTGFELGADISITQDLDDVYVFDRNPLHTSRFYSEVLMRHIALELPDSYLTQTHKLTSGADFIARAFTGSATFTELSRAAEGVVRDLINVFTIAFFHAQKRGRDTIDKVAVVEASRQWFEQDKTQHLDAQMRAVLRSVVDDVIGNKRSRCFMLPRDLEKHPMMLRLFDARVVHHLQRGYADKDNPGLRYNIYSLDYGTYVDLIGTSREPQVEMKEIVPNQSAGDVIVPFADKRSIRRIVLKKEILEAPGIAN